MMSPQGLTSDNVCRNPGRFSVGLNTAPVAFFANVRELTLPVDARLYLRITCAAIIGDDEVTAVQL